MVTTQYEALRGAKTINSVTVPLFLRKYRGKSTDTKPTADVFNGSTFYEMDTSTTYVFDGETSLWLQTESGGGGGGDETDVTDEGIDAAVDEAYESVFGGEEP